MLSDTRVADAPPATGTTLWLTAMTPHTVENVDDSVIRLLNVELKQHEDGPRDDRGGET